MAEQEQDRLSWLDWLLIGALLLSLLGFAWYWYRSDVTQQNIAQSLSESWTNVMVVDMYATHDNTEKNILKGGEMVLLSPVNMDDTVNLAHLTSTLSPHNLQTLGLLAPVLMGTFTPQDPAFLALRLLSFSDAGRQMGLTPLYQAGIRAISFYRGRIALRLQLNSIDTEQVLGYVVMSDGSQRLIYLVPMRDRYLQDQTVPAIG